MLLAERSYLQELDVSIINIEDAKLLSLAHSSECQPKGCQRLASFFALMKLDLPS